MGRKNSFKALINRKILKHRQAFHHDSEHGFLRSVGKCYTYQN